jgi:hypothetical protein
VLQRGSNEVTSGVRDSSVSARRADGYKYKPLDLARLLSEVHSGGGSMADASDSSPAAVLATGPGVARTPPGLPLCRCPRRARGALESHLALARPPPWDPNLRSGLARPKGSARAPGTPVSWRQVQQRYLLAWRQRDDSRAPLYWAGIGVVGSGTLRRAPPTKAHRLATIAPSAPRLNWAFADVILAICQPCTARTPGGSASGTRRKQPSGR